MFLCSQCFEECQWPQTKKGSSYSSILQLEIIRCGES